MKNVKNRYGFALIEIIISIALIGIIIIPISGLFLQSTKNNMDSKIKTQTVTLAQSVMEYYKGSGINNLNHIIALICGRGSDNTLDGDTASLYYFYKAGEDLSTILSDSRYDYHRSSEKVEQFSDLLSLAGSKDFDYAIKVVLCVKDGDNKPEIIDLIQISTSVWYKPLGDAGKVNFISLRGK